MPDTFEPAPPSGSACRRRGRGRLDDALPYVIGVERVLRADFALYPVFTDSKVRLPG